VRRDEATKRIETVVAHAIAGGEYAGLVDAVWVFGSYAAGAPNVNDIDLVVEHRQSKRLLDDMLRSLSYGGNANRGLDRELRGTWRNVKIQYCARVKESYEQQGGFTFVLIWRRGEPLSLATQRLAAIEVDPNAGSAPRDHVIPALAGFEKKVALAYREQIEELVSSGRVVARRNQLPDSEPRDEWMVSRIGESWAATNPKRRAALALAARIEQEGAGEKLRIGEGRIGAIRSEDFKLRGFLGANKIVLAAETLSDRAELAIVVLNDTSWTRIFEVIELRRGPSFGP
jgi:hypothetical protein